MSFVAILPVEDVAAANAALEAQGFGPGNFRVPGYYQGGPRYGMLHCWDNPAFLAAVSALPNVSIQDGPIEGSGPGGPVLTDDPPLRVSAVAAANGCVWDRDIGAMPDAPVTAGQTYKWSDDSIWYVIQSHDRAVYGGNPDQYPALMRRVRNPHAVEQWRQPIDQYDAYKLVNPFTGSPDRCFYDGREWRVVAADASGNNVWAPGVFGWDEV